MGVEPPEHWSKWAKWSVVSPWRFALILALFAGFGAGIVAIFKHGNPVNVLLAAVGGGIAGLILYRMSYLKYMR